MLPDKIYIHRTPILSLLAGNEKSVNAPGEQEYVRKETLYEWAKEQLRLNPYDAGMINLLNKLNSL